MSADKQYYISLGAGYHQLPLIRAARELGFLVIGIDRNIEAEGLSECDLVIEESIFNYRKVYYKITMNVTDGYIAGGFSASYGQALLSWAFIAERLKLNALPLTLTEVLTDKISVREKLSELKHPKFAQPAWFRPYGKINREEIEKFGLPVIVKSRNGAAKKNVFEAANFADLKKLLTKKYLKSIGVQGSDILIEKKIYGEELIVTGLVDDFKFNLTSITDKKAALEAPFLDLEHRFPSKFNRESNDLINIHQMITDLFQIPMGPIVSEWLYHDGQYYLVELSPQIAGEFIPQFIIKGAIRYDYYENLVRLTTGEPVDEPVLPRKPRKTVLRFLEEKIPPAEWNRMSDQADFAKILNRDPQSPPRGNIDRFAVLGYMS